MIDIRYLGQAGVYRVASELSLRGLEVYFPSIDVGVDLMIGNGARIQVKTATALERRDEGKTYRIRYGVRGREYGPRKYSDEVDIFVIWGLDENRFWVAPASLFDKSQNVTLRYGEYEARSSRGLADTLYDYENRWDLIVDFSKLKESK